ncbi:MAG: paraquat-inducible protein B [Gammaproteobacteria bacterium]|jgi:paraquat-inducible protein B
MEVANPKINETSGISMVWIIPILTALVGGWLIVKTISDQGPVATISFLTADGIEVGTTKIKYKNVNIGEIEGMEFSEDFSHVLLTARFNKGMDSFLRRNTQLWVVRPQLSLSGVSGLDTLVSGAYISIEPGQGAPQFHFVGLEKPPVVLSETLGQRIVLIADKLGSIDTGSPVYYKGIQAGEVLAYELANDRESVYIHIFINDPYDQLIRGNTHFWNVSGMEVDVSADGVNVRTESVKSLIFGGIAFDTPDTLEQVTNDTQGLVYTLYNSYDDMGDNIYSRKINYVAYFNGSVRGLSPGAPVEFRGIQVGSVLDFRLEYDLESSGFMIPVLFELEPERIVFRDEVDEISTSNTLNSLINNGLRARLQSGSLITGQLYIELVMNPDSPIHLLARDDTVPEMPTVSSASIESITNSLEAFVSRLDTIKLEEIGKELLGTLEGTNKLFSSPVVQASLDSLEASMESFRNILAAVDEANLNETIAAGHDVLEKFSETLELTNSILEPNSPMQYNVIQLTGELEETARSIRALVEILERNPQSLLFGRGSEEE